MTSALIAAEFKLKWAKEQASCRSLFQATDRTLNFGGAQDSFAGLSSGHGLQGRLACLRLLDVLRESPVLLPTSLP